MKYRILRFIIVIMLAGCNVKHNDGDRSINSSDSLSGSIQNETAKHHGGLIDSIREPSLRALVMKDSIELLAVKHVMSDTYHVEQILYMDYHHYSTEDPDLQYQKLRESYPLFKDITMNNPVPDFRGSYPSVFSYRGHFVTSDVSDGTESSTSEMVIADSAILWFFMMPDIMLYRSGTQNGDRIFYVVSDSPQNTDTIEIRRLHGDLDLQVWKWNRSGQVEYSLRIPSEKFVPRLIERNTLGEGAGMTVDFDHINYDSLMNSK